MEGRPTRRLVHEYRVHGSRALQPGRADTVVGTGAEEDGDDLALLPRREHGRMHHSAPKERCARWSHLNMELSDADTRTVRSIPKTPVAQALWLVCILAVLLMILVSHTAGIALMIAALALSAVLRVFGLR